MISRCGLREPSFELAAEAYTEAVGGRISDSSVRRVTEGFGQQVAAGQAVAAQAALTVGRVDESPPERRVALADPITGTGNVSSDGTMILVRGEGWKEVKLAAFSQVAVLEPDSAQRRCAQRTGPRGQEDVVRLGAHSYCAGLWEADTFAGYQYAEGLRRGLDLVARLSSVHDAALWIERVTATNFPQAIQIVDWGHSTQHLWAVAKTVYGEGTAAATAWVAQRTDELWAGQVDHVIAALDQLFLDQPSYPEVVQQAPGYFRYHRERMRYDVFRAAGYPIGSGTVESGGKNVVHARMRRPGRGWGRPCAQGMLAALSELRSGRFDQAWRQVSRRAA